MDKFQYLAWLSDRLGEAKFLRSGYNFILRGASTTELEWLYKKVYGREPKVDYLEEMGDFST